MLSAIVSSAAAYAATNLDDLFVLMLLLAACRRPRRLVAGHILGVGTLTAIGLLGALGLQRLPLQYTGLLGFVPILLGVRALLQRSDTDEEDIPAANDIGVFGMALTTLGNGADNLGVYIPLFTGFTGGQCLIAVLVFTVLTALCWAAGYSAEFLCKERNLPWNTVWKSTASPPLFGTTTRTLKPSFCRCCSG